MADDIGIYGIRENRDSLLYIEQNSPINKLSVGSDTYTLLKAKLPLRLEQLEANKAITLSTDADDLDETASRWRELLPES